MAGLLVFRPTALLICVNDHLQGRKFDFERINNERGNNHERSGIVGQTYCKNHDYRGYFPALSSALSPSPSHYPPLSSTSHLWVTIAVILKAFQTLSPPLPPSPVLSGQWVSIRAWPLTQIGNKYRRAHETIMTGLRWKWIPASTLHAALLLSRPAGSCHGKQLSLDASWQPDSIASAIGPHPRAFSRQIASSTLKSNLLPAIGFYHRNRRFPLFLWTMQWE